MLRTQSFSTAESAQTLQRVRDIESQALPLPGQVQELASVVPEYHQDSGPVRLRQMPPHRRLVALNQDVPSDQSQASGSIRSFGATSRNVVTKVFQLGCSSKMATYSREAIGAAARHFAKESAPSVQAQDASAPPSPPPSALDIMTNTISSYAASANAVGTTVAAVLTYPIDHYIIGLGDPNQPQDQVSNAGLLGIASQYFGLAWAAAGEALGGVVGNLFSLISSVGSTVTSGSVDQFITDGQIQAADLGANVLGNFSSIFPATTLALLRGWSASFKVACAGVFGASGAIVGMFAAPWMLLKK